MAECEAAAAKGDKSALKKLAKLIRYYILTSTTEAGSGHPTSSMSATDLMTTLMFGGFFRFDAKNPKYHNNDRLIFSKGHASPLFYSLWATAGQVTEKELMTLRKFGSPLEGHPTMNFPFTEAATGSLGQGLSVGAGMAMNAKYVDKLPYKTYVLLGDSEMAEGSVWETIDYSAYNKLNNLIAKGVSPYGMRFECSHSIAEVLADFPQENDQCAHSIQPFLVQFLPVYPYDLDYIVSVSIGKAIAHFHKL